MGNDSIDNLVARLFIAEDALRRIALNVFGDNPAQNIAGEALTQMQKIQGDVPERPKGTEDSK